MGKEGRGRAEGGREGEWKAGGGEGGRKVSVLDREPIEPPVNVRKPRAADRSAT